MVNVFHPIIVILFISAIISCCISQPVDMIETATPTTEQQDVTENKMSESLRPANQNDLPDFDYSGIPVLTQEGTDWMKTNASYVTLIALRDEEARRMYLDGGKIEGVLRSCHPTPFHPSVLYSTENGCAPALRISNKTLNADFLVDEEKGRVLTVVKRYK